MNAKRQDYPASGNDLVAAILGHQNFSIGRVTLDLLAQTIHVGFKRVRRHPGIVTPHLLQQDITRHHGTAGAIEVTDDRRFLFRQTDFLAVFRRQQLLAGFELIGADGENRVLTLFVLTQLRRMRARSTAKRKGFVT